jgi:HEAT repeat protein
MKAQLTLIAAAALLAATALCLSSKKEAPAAIAKPQAAPLAKAKALAATLPITEQSVSQLVTTWNAATTKEQLIALADELAQRNTAESVQTLIAALHTEQHWGTRAELATSLRAVSNPETLPALLPELLGNQGRGSTVMKEITDAVCRMAQPDTVATLEAMHWQASSQAGQGHKILRTIGGIRNPAAKRALLKLAAHGQSEALAAAAQYAADQIL